MKEGRISGLDGIRAVAIISVILLHLSQRYGVGGFLPDGVGLFFVLSGYLITYLLLKEFKKTGHISLSSFYIKRFFRIIPPLYGYLAFILIYGAATGIHLNLTSIVGPALFLQNLMPHPGARLVEHTWSLSVEEQFYILWPVAMVVALKLGGRRAALMLALSTVVLAPAVRILCGVAHLGNHHLGQLLLTRMDALGAGCFVALAEGGRRFELVFERVAGCWWVFASVIFIAMPLLLSRSMRGYLAVGFTIDAVCMALFILWVSRNPRSIVGLCLNHPVAVQIGVFSYSIYLWQTFFIVGNTGVHRLASMPLGLFLVVAAAWLSYTFIEQPAFRMRQRVLTSRRVGRVLAKVRARTGGQRSYLSGR